MARFLTPNSPIGILFLFCFVFKSNRLGHSEVACAPPGAHEPPFVQRLCNVIYECVYTWKYWLKAMNVFLFSRCDVWTLDWKRQVVWHVRTWNLPKLFQGFFWNFSSWVSLCEDTAVKGVNNSHHDRRLRVLPDPLDILNFTLLSDRLPLCLSYMNVKYMEPLIQICSRLAVTIWRSSQTAWQPGQMNAINKPAFIVVLFWMSIENMCLHLYTYL